MGRMRTDPEILGVDVAIGEINEETPAKTIILVFLEWPVDVAPADLGLARRLADDELVPGRAARVRPGADHQRPVRGEDSLLRPDRALVEVGRREVCDRSAADPLDLRRSGRHPGHPCGACRGHILLLAS